MRHLPSILRAIVKALCLAALALSTMVATACASSPKATKTAGPAGFRPFAPDSIWNLPLRSDAPLDPDSDKYMNAFDTQVARFGGYVNGVHCGTPIYWAPASTPRIAVRLDHPAYMDPGLIKAWSSVPVPDDARPANCSDANLAILQRQPDGTVDEWELFGATRTGAGRWTARWGGATQDVQQDRGSASPLSWADAATGLKAKIGWNVTASSISTLAGVITTAELKARRVDHALALAITNPAKNIWRWPAQRSDGSLTDRWALPEGAHLRLDPRFDLATLKGATPLVRMLGQAAQKYGIVVRDATSSVEAFYAQEPAPGQPDLVKQLVDGQFIQPAMEAFPWDHLQLLAATTCHGYANECIADDDAVLDADVSADGTSVRLDTTNSVLNQPRADVRWDLDGDGTYETAGGRAVARTVAASDLGARVGVQITTRGGATVNAVTTVPRAGQR